MKRCKLWIATIGLASVVGSARADPIAMGRRMAETFLSGDLEAIWVSSTPEMRQAFGSTDNLALLREDLLTDFGAEEAILSERAKTQAGLDVFTRISRWSNTPVPLEIPRPFAAGQPCCRQGRLCHDGTANRPMRKQRQHIRNAPALPHANQPDVGARGRSASTIQELPGERCADRPRRADRRRDHRAWKVPVLSGKAYRTAPRRGCFWR
ncbi:hypothetical protein SAMN04488238_109178 [Roseicitreum antarcticum]|uniref:Uncharacterized protein n=1 Tax=Roseicitreum antarcticum TaxID=564137 RepID=A0A1H3CIP1_9RHOB|nr:hypothetical protein SAMN04488238_109178 [Roseicitreum antarcticum]